MKGKRGFIIFVLLLAAGLTAGVVRVYVLYRDLSNPARLIAQTSQAISEQNPGRAEVLIRNVISQEPADVATRIVIADMLNIIARMRGQRSSPAAVEQLSYAAKLAPKNVEIQGRLFAVWHRLGRKEAALETARTIVELGSNDATALMTVADAEFNAGNRQVACQLIDRLSDSVGVVVSAEFHGDRFSDNDHRAVSR
ncbi:MAG: hypothetical protein O3B13_07605 [Planctomycetota bacterium]|nr:hypothetical protein [Planctomycetota bacterium]